MIENQTIVFCGLKPTPLQTSRHLWGRGFSVIDSNQVEQAIEAVKQFPYCPVFVSIQWSEKDRQRLLAAHPLKNPFVIYFSEEDSYQAYAKLKSYPQHQVILGPISGPAIERLLRGWGLTPDHTKNESLFTNAFQYVTQRLNQYFDHQKPKSQHVNIDYIGFECVAALGVSGVQTFIVASSHADQENHPVSKEIVSFILDSLAPSQNKKELLLSSFSESVQNPFFFHLLEQVSSNLHIDYHKGEKWLVALKEDCRETFGFKPHLKSFDILEINAEVVPIGVAIGVSLYFQSSAQAQALVLTTSTEALTITKKNLLLKHGIKSVFVKKDQWEVFLQNFLKFQWDQQTHHYAPNVCLKVR